MGGLFALAVVLTLNRHAREAPPSAESPSQAVEAAVEAAVEKPAPDAGGGTAAQSPLPGKGTGSVTGLAVPRYVSLAKGKVNFRVGPGDQYPIEWEVTRRNMPVQVIEEYDVWRKIRDYEGVEGWVHSRMLSGKRALIAVKPGATLHEAQSFDSPPVARMAPTAVALLEHCESGWCRVSAQGYEGWIHHETVWGTEPNETY